MTVSAVILAAGEGQRWDSQGHKLLANLNGKPVVSWAIESAVEAELDDLIVITGSVNLSDLVPNEVTLLHNENWKSGQSSSLLLAANYAKEKGHDAVVVGLGDMPGVPKEAWISVAECSDRLVVATLMVKEGHQQKFPRSFLNIYLSRVMSGRGPC